jgi:hypothetical protein
MELQVNASERGPEKEPQMNANERNPTKIPMTKLKCQTKSQVQMSNAPAHFDIGALGFESFVCHWDFDIGICSGLWT